MGIGFCCMRARGIGCPLARAPLHASQKGAAQGRRRMPPWLEVFDFSRVNVAAETFIQSCGGDKQGPRQSQTTRTRGFRPFTTNARRLSTFSDWLAAGGQQCAVRACASV